MRFIPLLDRVVVKDAPPKEKTDGGIYLPTNAAQEQLIEGTVAIVGKGIEGVEFSVKVGDKVLYSSSAGGEITIEESPCRILSESDIWAVL